MTNFIPFLTYVFVTTFTPGPNNIMSMTNANLYGYRRTVKFTLGVCTGFFVVMMLSSYFNLLLFNLIPTIKFYMGILGAAYMLYLAYKIIRSTYRENENPDKQAASFLSGVLLQFFNPKGIVYGITVTSNFIIPYYTSHVYLVLFSLLLALTSLISTSSWAFFGALFQKFLYKYRKPFNIVMGLLLVYTAISILL